MYVNAAGTFLLLVNGRRALRHSLQGVTLEVQAQVFNCLRSWLVAGEVQTTDLAKTALFAYAFEALASEDLFDAAVDVICDLIHETQELDENMAVIQLIVPRVISLKPLLIDHKDDPEKIKGYTRILAEAGETYRILLLQHSETFFPILEAIAECSAYPDLDVVPITFPFWMRLAQSIGKKPSVSPLFMDAYTALMGVIIGHLHFPPVQNALSGQEAESFRSFRHVMGDTLKDCCWVLGTDTCLLTAYQMITTALSRSSEAITWQEVEAPLFAMRSMGAEVDPFDNNAVPKIMELIPSLPTHPRVRYAALLIISRYTEWINIHPEYIQRQLEYVSAGFEESDTEVLAAAGQALKYLCQDCKQVRSFIAFQHFALSDTPLLQHLVDFLPTLHTFLRTTSSKLDQADRRQVYEAIAHVISAMPMERAAESLRTFSLNILSQVHVIATQQRPATKQELKDVGGKRSTNLQLFPSHIRPPDGLENLEMMLHVIQTFGDHLPAACGNSCSEAWAVFDAFISKYRTDYHVAERTTRVLRHGITLFGDAALPIAPSVLSRMSTAFELTGFPSYLWIAGKVIGRFGNEEDPSLRSAILDVYERSTEKLIAMLHQKTPNEIPDGKAMPSWTISDLTLPVVMEDYLQMLLQLIEFRPDIFFQSSAFPMAFKAAMTALTLIHSDIIFAALDLFRIILGHECLAPPSVSPPPPKFPIYAAAISGAVEGDGYELLRYLLLGLTGDFPEDSTSAVVSIIRSMATVWTSQFLSWLPTIVQQLPSTTAPSQAKSQFVDDVNRYA